jgi:hypothetical protein
MIFILRKKDPNDPRSEFEIWKDELENSPDNGKLIVRNSHFFGRTRIGGQKYRFYEKEEE